jgi:hypothetical protein
LGSATVTSDLILSAVAAGIPDLDSLSTDLYGRPAMIFLALAPQSGPGKLLTPLHVASQ